VSVSSPESRQGRGQTRFQPPLQLQLHGNPRVRRSSAYDANFERHLSDHGIHLPFRGPQGPKPDIAEIRFQLSARRPSLSPSRFDDMAFDNFVRTAESESESSVMTKVIPIIAGNASIPNGHSLQFTNLDRLVVPTNHANEPVPPNFFLDVKSHKGSPAVVRRQACLDGAYGARAMHSLQSYREEVPTYTAEVHAYSSTYSDGVLKLYAHQVTAPTGSDGQPEYLMTQISCHALTDDRSAFVAGATAYRNAKDLAQRHRDELIQRANAKARDLSPSKQGPTLF